MKYLFNTLLLFFSLILTPAHAQEGGSADVNTDELSEGISTDCETGTCGSINVNGDILTENAYKASLQAKGSSGTTTRTLSPSGSDSKVNE